MYGHLRLGEAMKREPKIKPTLMWGCFDSAGKMFWRPTFLKSHSLELAGLKSQSLGLSGELFTVQRVLVTAPPKRKKIKHEAGVTR